MSMHPQDRVEEHRAAVLLGLPATKLRCYSRVSGLGHLEDGDRSKEMAFN
jgi:hypothetical protein